MSCDNCESLKAKLAEMTERNQLNTLSADDEIVGLAAKLAEAENARDVARRQYAQSANREAALRRALEDTRKDIAWAVEKAWSDDDGVFVEDVHDRLAKRLLLMAALAQPKPKPEPVCERDGGLTQPAYGDKCAVCGRRVEGNQDGA
jgi:hypothetical protein